MTSRTPIDSLADAAQALVLGHDTADLLLRLTADAVHFTGGDAAGLLVRTDGNLELLSATSHAATELELYQAMRSEGPCVDVLESREQVQATGRQEILDRWPTVGRAVVDAGFLDVHAFPLAWQGGILGGLNIFGREPRELDESQRRTAQAFADMLALAVVVPEEVRAADLSRRVARALGGRVVIEQAKGAIAHQLDIDVAAAYAELVERSAREGASLTATARKVLWQAQTG
jgi:GAF domain-containing protein/ANTAR domain-containing protein